MPGPTVVTSGWGLSSSEEAQVSSRTFKRPGQRPEAQKSGSKVWACRPPERAGLVLSSAPLGTVDGKSALSQLWEAAREARAVLSSHHHARTQPVGRHRLQKWLSPAHSPGPAPGASCENKDRCQERGSTAGPRLASPCGGSVKATPPVGNAALSPSPNILHSPRPWASNPTPQP